MFLSARNSKIRHLDYKVTFHIAKNDKPALNCALFVAKLYHSHYEYTRHINLNLKTGTFIEYSMTQLLSSSFLQLVSLGLENSVRNTPLLYK